MHFICLMTYSVMDFKLSSIAYKVEIPSSQQFQSTIKQLLYGSLKKRKKKNLYTEKTK